MQFEREEFQKVQQEISERLVEIQVNNSVEGLEAAEVSNLAEEGVSPGPPSEDLESVCVDCGEELSQDYLVMYEDEKLSRLKHILDSLQVCQMS